jgi:predicted DNA-binding transcriptional regulator
VPPQVYENLLKVFDNLHLHEDFKKENTILVPKITHELKTLESTVNNVVENTYKIQDPEPLKLGEVGYTYKFSVPTVPINQAKVESLLNKIEPVNWGKGYTDILKKKKEEKVDIAIVPTSGRRKVKL